MNNHDDKKKGTGSGAVVGAAAGGVAGGAAAGMLVGGMTGPVGAAVGAAVGAVVGAVSGRKADPVAEESYWRDNYASRPYVQSGASFDDYGPAYRHGAEARNKYEGRAFDDVESDLGREWGSNRGQSSLGWEHAKHASRDAWDRVSNTAERLTPGDSDKDGR